jgi:predicted AlkP superfamily phosphohydrolase/phosphomutase
LLAGAGDKAGSKYGASDEIGYKVANDPVSIYDFHATILHLMGINHEKLSYYHNGIARRLTDVHGHVAKGLLA